MHTDAGWLGGTAGAIGVALVLLAVSSRRGSRLLPVLPDADPSTPARARDRVRYHAANTSALALGALAAVLLHALLPAVEGEMLWSPFAGAGRWIAPLFAGLAVACFSAPWLLQRIVSPGPLLHLLHGANRHHGGTDMRPLCRLLGGIVAVAALELHLALAGVHTHFREDGVAWQDFPWQGEQHRPWSEVADVRIVGTFVALTGREIPRPHLGITFRDGTVIHVGTRDHRPPGYWEAPAAFAAARARIPVRRVARE